MSEDLSSSGDEGALCIDMERRSNTEKGKGGRVGGKGRARGSGGTKKNDRQDLGGTLKPGDVVWAKVTGFNFWPAKIFDAVNDEVVPHWLKLPPKPTYMLVRFFGTYDMQWVSPNSIETYDRGINKRFHSKSRSKVFQKAVKEVFAYIEDSVMPEGLTLRPPDPPVFSEEEDNVLVATDKQASTCVTRGDESAPSNGSTHIRGSSRRKCSTPRRLSSSSSDSLVKRPCLNSTGEEEGNGLPLSPEVQAFTCAPLPLATPSAQHIQKPEAIKVVPDSC